MCSPQAIVNALAAATPVFVAGPTLLRLFDEPPESVIHALRLAIEAGLLTVWDDSPLGPAVILTTLSCERMSLTLSDDEDLSRSHWVPAGGEGPARVHKPRPADRDGNPADALEALPSREPDPALAVEAMDEFEAGLARRPAGRKRSDYRRRRFFDAEAAFNVPWALVMASTADPTLPWKSAEIAKAAGRACPVCGDVRLRGLAVCLGCLRSGLDHISMFKHVVPLKKDKPDRPKHEAHATARSRSTGKRLRGGRN